jgi:hypothetical protein
MSAPKAPRTSTFLRCGARWGSLREQLPFARLEIASDYLRVTLCWFIDIPLPRAQIARITRLPPGALRIEYRPSDRRLILYVDALDDVVACLREYGYTVETPAPVERKPSRWRPWSD